MSYGGRKRVNDGHESIDSGHESNREKSGGRRAGIYIESGEESVTKIQV